MLYIFPFQTILSCFLRILGSFGCLNVDIKYYVCLWNLRPFLCSLFLSGSSLALLALFMNNLCISLFMNDLNMDPSLNLIIKNHIFASFWFHLYPTHWHLWNGARFNCFFFFGLCIHYFYFYSLLCFLFLRAWGVEYLIWACHLVWGASEKASWEPLFILLEFSGCLKNYADHIRKSREKRLRFNHCENVGLIILRMLVLWRFWIEPLLCLQIHPIC